MKTYYPPVGISHITEDIKDLFTDRLATAQSLRIACISQPKSAPHFGTMIVVFTAFALAKKLSADFRLPTNVLVDILDNAPAKEQNTNEELYVKCLSHHMVDGENVAEKNIFLLNEIIGWASMQSGIEFVSRKYREIQSQKKFREGIIQILKDYNVFLPIMSPSEHHLRIRPICTDCGLVDKLAKTVQYNDEANPSKIYFECPIHGAIEVDLNGSEGWVDANAPIRTVLRSVCFAHDKQEAKIETVIVNGADWAGAWMQRVYFDGLSNFNITGLQVPFNLFTPEITDGTGAKLSKTIYLEKGAYGDIDPAWLSTKEFMAKFGERGLQILWKEVEAWVNNPQKLFRNYSIGYMQSLYE